MDFTKEQNDVYVAVSKAMCADGATIGEMLVAMCEAVSDTLAGIDVVAELTLIRCKKSKLPARMRKIILNVTEQRDGK